MPKPISIAVLISGRGSNLLSLINSAKRDFSAFRISLVISDHEAAGLAHARAAGIATKVIPHVSRDAFAAAAERAWVEHGIDLVALAGFMRVLDAQLVARWNGRIINIHPSLLPDFAGLHPHRQALAADARISGCTVHYVTPEVDAGPIISQAAVSVLPDDTEESLASRILEVEHHLYPLVLEHLCANWNPVERQP